MYKVLFVANEDLNINYAYIMCVRCSIRYKDI